MPKQSAESKPQKQTSFLAPMPLLKIDVDALKIWGETWKGSENSSPSDDIKKSKSDDRFAIFNAAQKIRKKSRTTSPDAEPKKKKSVASFNKQQGMRFGLIFDEAFSLALSDMLGEIPLVPPVNNSLLPPPLYPNSVELGKTRIVGGIRPQNYDAAYRPDGPRIVYDSKTLNDAESIRKNWQNMVNDLATEASTVHTRFPYCIVAFIVVLPEPALHDPQKMAIIRTLERLGSRDNELDQHHLAESIALCVWNPDTGQINPNIPLPTSSLRIENMPKRIYESYLDRYRNLPPHEAEDAVVSGEDE
ncbi:hypothetical protein [Methylobacterium indicum]|uniref:Uncharacterized protein n=1 Tax=Methylobacterium indicum TaxID=1775910 RepID=A0A8H8WSM3_9HYPH|nr:hypothetical protein [Methylobacterium indicum]BCM83550.1 hypothetical protein mvi_20110 [Methylobacterium indicum]